MTLSSASPGASLPTDVFITDELARRVPLKVDYLQEKLALQDLAARMAGDPTELLPRFVELAMQVTDGTAAGLSLYESEPAPGVFRWHHLCGSLMAFTGTTTPRHHSPCGVTLDRNAPVLTRHAERMYAWISDAGLEVPELLLVPLYVDGSDPLGTLWVVSDVEGHFDAGHARVTSELATFVGIVLRMTRTEERLRRALEEQETLTREMNHRVKNLFALADSMIRFGAKAPGGKQEMAQTLLGRLQSLATAHALVLPGIADGSPSKGASELATVIAAVTKPHEHSADATSRFSMDGPQVDCGTHAISGLALVVHELATNAAKYGALTTQTGHVTIKWCIDAETLILTWAENGGPRADVPPSRQGFGTKLVRNTVVRQFRGSVTYEWRTDGLVVELRLPVEGLAA